MCMRALVFALVASRVLFIRLLSSLLLLLLSARPHTHTQRTLQTATFACSFTLPLLARSLSFALVWHASRDESETREVAKQKAKPR